MFHSLKGKLYDLYSRVRYYRESDFIFYLDTMEEYIAAMDMPYPKRLEVAKQLATKAKESGESKRDFGILLVIPWDEYVVHDAKTRAQVYLSETALAIERYRLAHHDQLPATLQDLVPAYLPAVPADPFDGKPLRYQMSSERLSHLQHRRRWRGQWWLRMECREKNWRHRLHRRALIFFAGSAPSPL